MITRRQRMAAMCDLAPRRTHTFERRDGVFLTVAAAILFTAAFSTSRADENRDANHRWPDFLAHRLAQAEGAPIAVLNEGISGARVLRDRMGLTR
jgi:hypothetical protein